MMMMMMNRMIMIIVMMMIEDELEIQELLPPISLQFISLAKLSPGVPHLTALHCKPLHRILVEMGRGDLVMMAAIKATVMMSMVALMMLMVMVMLVMMFIGIIMMTWRWEGVGGRVVLLQELCCYH